MNAIPGTVFKLYWYCTSTIQVLYIMYRLYYEACTIPKIRYENEARRAEFEFLV